MTAKIRTSIRVIERSGARAADGNRSQRHPDRNPEHRSRDSARRARQDIARGDGKQHLDQAAIVIGADVGTERPMIGADEPVNLAVTGGHDLSEGENAQSERQGQCHATPTANRLSAAAFVEEQLAGEEKRTPRRSRVSGWPRASLHGPKCDGRKTESPPAPISARKSR